MSQLIADSAAVSTPNRLRQCLSKFLDNIYAFSPRPVTTPIPFPPTSSAFRDAYVNTSTPVLFSSPPLGTSGCHWDDLGDVGKLEEVLGDSPVTVNVTPSHGYGDYVVTTPMGKRFVKPMEERMLFKDFLSSISVSSDEGDVYYYSHQNDCLRQECSKIVQAFGIPTSLPYFSSSFSPPSSPSRNNPPDAVNLWVGDGRAITSLHSDPYENIYIVTKGVKTFTLLPPFLGGFLDEGDYSPATFQRRNGALTPVDDEDQSQQPTRWLTTDIDNLPDHLSPFVVTINVEAGQTLYLPALWYHRVSSSGTSVAVNYWFDMEFNSTWSLVELAKDVGEILKSS